MSTPVPAAPAPHRPTRLSAGSWVLYDLANTIFSLGIVTTYYPGLLKALGHEEGTVATLDAVAAALVFVLAPVLGALSDQASRRLPFLVVSTVLCVGLTFALGLPGLFPGFVLFVLAVVGFQAGMVFYDSLLPEVSTDETRGRVGGIGVGVGYVGSLVALVVGNLLLSGTARTPEDYGTVIRAIAVAFLVFALPAFLFVRERRRAAPPLSWGMVRGAFGELATTARRAREYRGLGRFLLGRMLYADAANTLIFMVFVYATGTVGFSDQEAELVAAPSIVAAIAAGIAWGVVVDRVGPKRTLDTVLVLWLGVFVAAAGIPVLGLPRELFWGVAFVVGICLAGTWSADRPLMARLAPPRYYGQFFGLYAMVGRFGAILGPSMWAVVVALGLGQPVAVAILAVLVLVAFLVLRPVDDRPREWGPDDLPELETPA